MNTNLLIFILFIVLSTFFVIIIIKLMNDRKYLENVNAKQHKILEQNNSILNNSNKALTTLTELENNDVGFNNGFDMGVKAGTEDISPYLIEKAYQLGINDAERVKERNRKIGEMFDQGIKVDFDIETPKQIANYVKNDETVSTEPFVSVGQSLEDLLRVPKGIKIENYKIVDTEYEGMFGRYTVYKTKTGKRFHFKKGCCGADVPYLSFFHNGRNWYDRCDKCCSEEQMYLLNVPEWYKDFRDYKKKKRLSKDNSDKTIRLGTYEQDFVLSEE